MKYKSELLNEILEQRGHEVPNLHYQSECIETWIEENKGAYPKLCDYESEWLNYIYENPIGEFPYETVTTNTTATVNNVVPFEYKSAILTGKTLVNIHPKNYKMWMNTDTIFSIDKNIDISLIKPNTKYFIRIYNAPSNIYRIYFKPCDTTYVTFTDINNKYTIHTTKSDLSEYNDAGKIHIYTSPGTTATQADVENVKVIICEYQEGMENWDIPYFEGMKSVKMPVLTTTGENLIDSEIIAGWLNTSNGEINNLTSTTTCATKDLIKVKPATQYSVYKEYDKRVLYAQFNEKQEFINFGAYTHNGFTTDSNAVYVRLFFETPVNEELKVMLYEGGYNSNISYEPYKSNILSTPSDLELRGIGDVKDELNLITDELTQRIGEVVLDGSENWTSTTGENTNTIRVKWISNLNPKLVNDSLPIKCDKFKNEKNAETDTESIQLWGSSKEIMVRISKTKATTVDEFKQWLSQNQVTLQYELATPTIKTVDLITVNQDGESLNKIKPIEGTMHVEVSGTPINPTAVLEVPVEAITQNLNSFIEGE